jgi:DNA processing protein
MNKHHLILHLTLIHNVGPGAIIKLAKIIAQVKNIDRWYAYRATDFVRFGIGQPTAQKIVDGLDDMQLLEQELALIEKYTISWVTILDESYPEMLSHINIPPPVLYWQGEPAWKNANMVAFVGARKGNNYGQRAVQKLIPTLVSQNYVIVSGGAYGIDTMAHRATVDAGGKTIVVIGAGLLQPYLAQNKSLFKQIIATGGAIVSGFPLLEEASAWTFPKRNRIIAGLSQGCVVVQAAKKSGALITAKYALQEGRQVFAVPGQFDDDLSMGCHGLLKDGAKLVQNTQDILEEFGIEQSEQEAEDVQLSIQPEHPILIHCAQPIGLMDLSQKTNIKQTELEQQLFELQLDGKVQQDFAGLWQII